MNTFVLGLQAGTGRCFTLYQLSGNTWKEVTIVRRSRRPSDEGGGGGAEAPGGRNPFGRRQLGPDQMDQCVRREEMRWKPNILSREHFIS